MTKVFEGQPLHASTYPSFPVLMVDDEKHLLIGFDTVLRGSGINNIISCQDSREVMPIIAGRPIEVMLLDLFMPHFTGEDILAAVCLDFPEVPVIVITGVDDVETAVRCIKTGAFDYMVKPVEEARLLTSVKRAIEFRELQRENLALKAHIVSARFDYPEAFSKIVTVNESMHAVLRYAQAIAGSPMPMLITGETGTGKELLAEAIHTLSLRRGDLVKVNIAGIDDLVFADTLFGHTKGAFTGAHQARGGLVERADGGTLFLDEIGDLNFSSQIKLLRLMQNREYYPLGADQPKFSDARIVVATNSDLSELIQSGKLRQDLYYRLQTHHIHIPPLRERLDDIKILMEHFLKEASKTLGKKKPTVPEELHTLLGTYHFPGNLRELQSMVFDAVSRHASRKLSTASFNKYICEKDPSKITAKITDAKQLQSNKVFDFSEWPKLPFLKEAEENLIAEALKRSKGNQNIAARLLGISRQALNRRLKAKG